MSTDVGTFLASRGWSLGDAALVILDKRQRDAIDEIARRLAVDQATAKAIVAAIRKAAK
jgi:predicted transcriptional regulator